MSNDCCNSCGSNRLAFIQAHSKDLSFFSCAHLSLEHDGYFPEIPGVCSGDDADFFFCLQCGKIQGDGFPITDETIKEAFDDYADEPSEPSYDLLDVPSLVINRLDDKSNARIEVAHRGEFMNLPWVVAIKKHPDFRGWALARDPTSDSFDGITLLSVSIDPLDSMYIDIVAHVPHDRFNFDEIEWVDVISCLRKED